MSSCYIFYILYVFKLLNGFSLIYLQQNNLMIGWFFWYIQINWKISRLLQNDFIGSSRNFEDFVGFQENSLEFQGISKAFRGFISIKQISCVRNFFNCLPVSIFSKTDFWILNYIYKTFIDKFRSAHKYFFHYVCSDLKSCCVEIALFFSFLLI